MRIVALVLTVLLLSSCPTNFLTGEGPVDEPHPDASGNLEMVIWVSPSGNDTNPGTRSEPVRTIQLAINRMGLDFRETSDIPRLRYEIRVGIGTFTPGSGLVEENIGIALLPYTTVDGFYDTDVILSGGWDLASGVQLDLTDRANLSILDGEGVLKHVMLIDRDRLTVSGFVVTGGVADGPPAGIREGLPYGDERLADLWTKGGGLYIAPGLDPVTVEDIYVSGNVSSDPATNAVYIVPRTNGAQRVPVVEIFTDPDSNPVQTVGGETSQATVASW